MSIFKRKSKMRKTWDKAKKQANDEPLTAGIAGYVLVNVVVAAGKSVKKGYEYFQKKGKPACSRFYDKVKDKVDEAFKSKAG